MTRSFEDVAVYSSDALNLTGDGRAVQVRAELVSPMYFSVLGVDVARGRAFRAEDDVVGSPAAVIISHGLWQGRYGADPNILGRTLTLDGRPATVIGVAKPGFAGLSFDTEIWSTWRPFLSAS